MGTQDYSYSQDVKKHVRHKILFHAIDSLTRNRERVACVSRNYVRKVYDYFTDNDDTSKNKDETKKIDKSYITNWEALHDVCIGNKNVRELTVCYLCGPEPGNDFQELIDLGILPQNIWAFESTNGSYRKALSTYEMGEFPQPRILKQNIESFFNYTPKKFDIVYIDACGSIPSAQHSLRCLSTLCYNSRLNSPGVVITNFAAPDETDEDISGYIDLISTYLFFKKYSDLVLDINDGRIENSQYRSVVEDVKKNFSKYYGEFVSAVLRDIPSVLIPVHRIAENPYFNQIINKIDVSKIDYQNLINEATGNSLARFFFYTQLQNQHKILPKRTEIFIQECGDKEKSILRGFIALVSIRLGKNNVQEEILAIRTLFENKKELKIHQFLDKPHSNLIFDAVINQLIYPMHFCPWHNWRYKYKAKTMTMYTDVSIYDECRYIYEWMPAIHQVESAFNNLSWQYVFRFAMDGLIKSRTGINNEFFYQGSVVPGDPIGIFKVAAINERVNANDV